MRVTHVITRLIVGGAQENTVASVLGLHAKPGVEVSLIAGPTRGPEGTLEPLFAEHPGVLKVLPSLIRPIRPWKDILALRELTTIFKAQSPDLVHTHSGKAGVLGRLAARRAQVPYIVHTIHGPSFGGFQGVVPNFIFRGAERYAARFTNHFVSVADAMTQQYLAAAIGHPGQFSRIWSGFDLKPFLSAKNDPGLRAKLGFGMEDVVVGKLARLVDLKGHEDLFKAAVRAIKACPRLKFLLVGDGPLRPIFEAQARALGLEKQFVFTGLVSPAEVPPLLGIMDVLVHLSRREGLPRALPQALAAGRPVVAWDCDGAREVCVSKQTGCLLKPGDLEGLVDSLTMLAKDPGVRERLGTRGQQLVRERFSVERMVEDLYALYKRLLNT